MDEKDVIIGRLEALVEGQQAQIRALTERIRELEDEVARLKKNSSNSSKPPSSDIVKPRPVKARRKRKRKRGGQHGHRKHVRPVFAGEQVDETGHKDDGRRRWTWGFRAEDFTLFKIDPSRGAQVLQAVLGETFGGVLGCDYFSAYRKYMAESKATVQFCLAHSIREVRFLAEHTDRVLARRGHKLLERLRRLFATLHRAAQMTRDGFARAMERIRREFLRQVRRPPNRREARTLARRFGTHGDSYFTFLTTPGVEPTNNLTEQAIRFVVIDRRITQGTRGERGQRWSERIWTVLASCAQQGRSAYQFLAESVTAHWSNHPAPSLLPANL